VQCYTFIVFSQSFSMVFHLAGVKKECHFCAHSNTHNLQLLLTDLNPRLSLLGIAMASSSCKILDSSVVTWSRTSRVLTKRTNMQRIHIRMAPPRNATRSCFRCRRQPTVPLLNHGSLNQSNEYEIQTMELLCASSRVRDAPTRLYCAAA
jgi:hypothetical protein